MDLKVKKNKFYSRIIRIIRTQVEEFSFPSLFGYRKLPQPFMILIACILSLRTQDRTTLQAAKRLFKVAPTVYKMQHLSLKRIERLIYPVGFYRRKAKIIKEISMRLVRDFSGKVPKNKEILLSFKGVGLKTANLVLGLGFGIPAICVDTHVHRIANRLGWVKTTCAEETEARLRKIIPKRYWIELNRLFVSFGQNICRPIFPWCSKCKVANFCLKRKVKKWR